MIKNKRKDKVFDALLCLYLFYYSYRYVCKYNFTGTSPTYHDTPLAFQLFKYVLLTALIFMLILQSRDKMGINSRNRMIAVITVFLSVQFLVLGVFSKSMDAIAFALLLLPSLFFLTINDCPNLENVEKVLLAFWWFSAVYEFVQFVLYYKNGRLPALAYPTGRITDVRFGGAWDDPNGYALLMIFYLFYFLFKYKGVKQLACLGFTALMLLLTWSGTGVIAFVASAVIIFFMRLNDRNLIKNYLYYGILLVVGLVTIVAMNRVQANITYFLQQKEESVSLHKSGWDLSELSILTYLGVNPDYFWTEVGYLRLLSIGGIPCVLAFLIIGIVACRRYRYFISLHNTNKPILYGSLAYLIAFLLFNFNLPHVTNFACMGVFSSLISIAWCFDNDSSQRNILIHGGQ